MPMDSLVVDNFQYVHNSAFKKSSLLSAVEKYHTLSQFTNLMCTFSIYEQCIKI